jgi:protein-L-isoaspartate O-methyltransferase
LSEGGTLVIPVGDIKHQKLHIIQRQKGKLTMKEENWRHFVPLIGTKGW